MSLNFPSNPVDGDRHTEANVTWAWSSTPAPGMWLVASVAGGGGGIPEAPADGVGYVRLDEAWASGDARYAAPGDIVTDHGALSGLADDDHTQYLNNTRGDARYLRLTGGTLTGKLTISTGGLTVTGASVISGGALTVNSNIVMNNGSGTGYLNMRSPTANVIRGYRGTTDTNIINANTGGTLTLGNSSWTSQRLDHDWEARGYLFFANTNTDPAQNNAAGACSRYNTTAPYMSIGADGNTPFRLNRRSTNGTIISFRRNANTVGTIQVTSSATSYNESSDESLKEQIKLLSPSEAVQRVMAVEVYEYVYKADLAELGEEAPTTRGFLAQQTEPHIPQAVSPAHTDPEGEAFPWMMDKSKMIPDLWATVQHLVAEVEALKGAST